MSRNGNRWSVNSVLAGAGGGFVSSIATCPLDVIKTKLQAQVTAHKDINYLGVWGEFLDFILIISLYQVAGNYWLVCLLLSEFS